MLFEGDAVFGQIGDVDEGAAVLQFDAACPNLKNAKILLGADGDAVDEFVVLGVGAKRFAAQRVEQLSPDLRHKLVGDLVGEEPAVAVLGIFPHGGDARAHYEQHAILDNVGGQCVCNGNQLLRGVDALGGNDFVAAKVPIFILW